MKNGAPRILVLDDDEIFLESMSSYLAPFGETVATTSKGKSLSRIRRNLIDIAFIDLNITGHCDGLEVVRESVENGIYTIVISSHDSEDIIEQAGDLGCHDYYCKGDDEKSVIEIMNKYKARQPQKDDTSFFENEFLTKDSETIESIQNALNNSTSKLAILVTGPTGIGKTILAQKIHDLSGRKGNFISLNLAEISENLIQSELFGHKKGSFTGASNDYDGKIKQADGGTLFLDEICSLPLSVQTKLLKVLDEKVFYPIGSRDQERSDFRIICASQNDLLKKVELGEFRRDLYYRISDLNIFLKPISKRKCDIPLILKKLLEGKKKIVLKDDAVRFLIDYHWPGNIREMKSFVSYIKSVDKTVITRSDFDTSYFRNSVLTSHVGISEELFDFYLEVGYDNFLEHIKKELYLKVLERNKGKIRTTVKELGISSASFYKITKLAQKVSLDEDTIH